MSMHITCNVANMYLIWRSDPDCQRCKKDINRHVKNVLYSVFLYFVFILVVINTSLQNPTQYLSLQVNSICKLITKLCCTWMLLHLTGSRTHVYWLSSIYFNFHPCFICSPANMLNLSTNKTISTNAFLKYFFRNFFYFVTKQVKLICIF